MKKTVLITGASSGIGKETAYVFAENGFDLILIARRLEKLNEIKSDILNKHEIACEVFDIDLSKTNSAEELMKQLGRKNLNVEVLINNAGFGSAGYFIDSDIQRDEDMLILNIVTLTKLTKLVAGQMVNNGGGHIINIASTAAFQPVPNLAVYSATKSYVLNFSEAIAYELKEKNIKVTVICPGATQSEFAEVAGFEEGKFNDKLPTSRDLGEFIYKEMIKGSMTSIHGFKNKFLVFTTRFSPRKMIVKIAAKMMK